MVLRNDANIVLPHEVSNEVLGKAQEASAAMRLATQVSLPGNGKTIPLITTEATASFVDEGEEKPVSNPGFNNKKIGAHTIAVIVPFSNQFRRDGEALYAEAVKRLPNALARKFDSAVFAGGSDLPSDFDTLADAQVVSLTADAYAGLVEADADIADEGYLVSGWALAPQARRTLLTAVDGNGRPLFVNSAAEGAVPMLLGAPTYSTKAVYVAGEEEAESQIGFAGDWTQAFYGVVDGISLSISDQATLTTGEGTINLWQRNMFAVRAEFEVGFAVADLSAFRALSA